MEWSSWNVITLVATTGVLSALLTQALTGMREWWLSSQNKKARAGYHALRLAVMLEAYASACAIFVLDNGNVQTPPDEEFPNWSVKLPDLLPYPDDTEGWHAIELKLAGRVLNFRNRVSGSQGVILSTAEFSEDELGDTLDAEAAGRGLEAWEIAVALRRRHGVDAVELIWDFIDSMQVALRSAERSKKEAAESRAALFDAGEVTPVLERVSDA
jgi:hypothetical protein